MGVALLACSFFAFAGCYPLTEWAPPAPKGPPAVTLPPMVKECKQAVEKNFVALVEDFADDGDADWQTELDDLVIQTSLCAVRVAAQQILDRPAEAKAQQAVDVKTRLKMWLHDHPNLGLTPTK